MKTAKQKERELIVKLHKEKKKVREIAQILGLSKSKVHFWIQRSKKTDSLEDKPRSGRPTPINAKALRSISNLINQNLINQRLIQPANRRAGVSTKEVKQLIKNKIKKKYSLRHVERIMHKMGFSLITPRPSHIKKDENAKEKFKVEFKKNLNRNIWAIQ